jgi:hypothetical protein
MWREGPVVRMGSTDVFENAYMAKLKALLAGHP